MYTAAMRSIFFRLLLAFTLILLLAGLISSLIMLSFSRQSADSFRRDFLQQLQSGMARSMVLMGQAAYVMHRYRGASAFEAYVKEIDATQRTRLYLGIDNTIVPEEPALEPDLLAKIASMGANDPPIIEEDGRELIVIQRLVAPEGQPYTMIGRHRLGPPPGMDKRLPPGERLRDGFPPPPPKQEGLFTPLGRQQELRLLVFLPIAGVICYLLARSFSAPLARLRAISRQIAAGDLSARVGASLGKPGNEIGDLARDFDHMAERMEGLVNGQKRLLLDISHELRSPLARLNLALELAKKRLPQEDGALAIIGRESERLNELIGQLLTLSRTDMLAPNEEASPVYLADLLLEIAEDVDFETRGQGKGVMMLAVAPAVVAGSRELLRQAIENIVRNGAHYTHPGSRVEIALSLIDRSGQGQALVRVRDHGPGVPEDKLPHLTEPFYRVAEARDRTSGGVGLGLAIARQAILQHGGSLRFANAPDRDGLVVEIELPVLEQPTATATNATGIQG